MNQQLERYNNDWYNPGSVFKRSIWYIVSLFFFETRLPFPSFIKIILLKLFGASVGNVTIKPNVKIKYPWFFSIGHNSWIGEGCIIDNVGFVKIGSNVCISQGVMVISGNHDWEKVTFDLLVEKIIISDHVWLGAKSIVLPKSILAKSVVICAGSTVSGKTKENGVYNGSPIKFVKYRNK